MVVVVDVAVGGQAPAATRVAVGAGSRGNHAKRSLAATVRQTGPAKNPAYPDAGL
ncbi:hypothetical protein [Bacillus cereus]|uniref:hypothetical protein n=1 Tax=Bacillus cereus TaxID=1396 RepID=UPI003F8ACAAF